VNAQTLPELKSEAMKARHWKQLLTKLRIKVNLADLTLGNLWQADLVKNAKVVAEVLTEARGELILEEFLRSIKDCWAKYALELIRYQSKCRLIRGWDDLFAQIDEHINNIASMKMSPYYKVFEEEIVPWDEKLQKIRLVFDTWIDVQRRYVYLEGIFFGSADIKSMLAAEFNKFRGIDSEFTALMKKVQAKPTVLDVMSIQGLAQNLERFADMLSRIQKALGDYLEKQRQSFARFYFVGDEDLLEIIGNSGAVRVVQRHFPKMFAGITSLDFEAFQGKDGDQLNGMVSREGELVKFSERVLLSADPTIHVWLRKVEAAMQMCLA
jgi:dynein heavy chain 1